ncbi:PTS system, mannose/fructose/sorbose family, IIA component [Clostridium putrefaciens]|uniref:PTS system, mannose/fructose/sorbose family, IIA component n=1 Tax=Clostridium putrefaciens TaxID=99675 RepID=A0A381J448_9CLOT|nr:mannose/fructose/sorbose PTS transporter subunit IIA [Clostridium putrefaciens]SUY45626.1 PTS system, mannose/fructose/sorbose family, IIA component [Clostridium putrefaciens]
MVGVIIGSHGRLSEEILRTSEMIFGKQENIQTVTFETGEGSEDLVRKYEVALGKLNKVEGILFLVDLFGGSPFNVATSIAINEENMDILTGVNLPMLLEVCGMRESLTLDEIVFNAEESGKLGIKKFEKCIRENTEEEL